MPSKAPQIYFYSILISYRKKGVEVEGRFPPQNQRPSVIVASSSWKPGMTGEGATSVGVMDVYCLVGVFPKAFPVLTGAVENSIV